MKDQHTKIKGYRDLSQSELDLMNEIKEHAQKTKELVEKIYEMNLYNATDYTMEGNGTDEDWLRNNQQADCLKQASPNLQQGFMWLTRSVALPESW